MELALNVPINSVSFGQVSVNILKELHKRDIQPCLFPIGSVDISAYDLSEEFKIWLQNALGRAFSDYKRSMPCLKLWHINGSQEMPTDNRTLLTYYETDSPTSQEINILRNTDKVIVTNNYTANILKDVGLDNVHVVPLGFDSDSFKIKKRKTFGDSRISFILAGKFEQRKRTAQILRAWAKKYGNNLKYSLVAAVTNPFLQPEHMQGFIAQSLEGKTYFNIKFLNWMPQNSLYNDFLNNGDIVIGMSGGEGTDIPVLTSIALGKHAVCLNAHSYKDYTNPENAVLVPVSGKEDCYDNMFFHHGAQFSQGRFFTWKDEDFIAGCESAIERVKKNPVNEVGFSLQEKYGYKQAVDKILEILK